MDIFVSAILILSITWIFTVIVKARLSSKLPPGPNGFPIIGNILALGSKPHQSFTKLSRKYGPVISLKLGSITTIVVSSPETAKIVLQELGLSCSGRAVSSTVEAVNHDKHSVGWRPVDNQWRNLRRICKDHMFSVSRMDASQGLRKEKLHKLCEYVTECSETGRVVDIGAAAFTTLLNLLSSTLFSVEFAQYDSDKSQEMKDVVWGLLELSGTTILADFFPILKSLDPRGISILKQMKIYFGKVLATFDRIIDERLESMQGDRQNDDLVGALIDINQRGETELSRDEINHLLFDMLVAGTDTTSSTVEWAMAELLRQPEKMSRVREEIRDVIGENGQIEESHIPRLPYLQAVVKEIFRLHPPAPLLLPHKALSDVKINGYLVPKNAQILVNMWAIGRDPSIWSNADVFMPERFLKGGNDHIDFKGRDFELIPFGAGGRICPGLPLAYRMVHLMLATLVGNFGWKLEEGKKPNELNMDEKFGLNLKKAIPLVAIPTKL